MMHVNDFLSCAPLAGIDTLVLLSTPPSEPVYTEEIAILCLNDVLFGIISKQVAKIDKISCLGDRVGNG